MFSKAAWDFRIMAAVALGLRILVSPASADAREPIPPRLSLSQAHYYKSHPAEWQQLLARLSRPPAQAAAVPPTGPWQATSSSPTTNGPSNPLLMTDGTVIVHDFCSPDWYRLTPDNTGSYINGTWSQVASMSSNYGPLYFASAVLRDGRVIVNGGEYNLSINNFCQSEWTNMGAIYDPASNSWASVSPPIGWSSIGDAQSVVRSDLTYMLANCCTTQQALLNATDLTWTSTGAGKFDINDEEGWTLLPSGNILTVDAYVFTGTCGTGSELYNPSTGSWSSAGSSPVQLSDCNPPNKSYELGPQLLRPDGSVVAFGGTTGSGASHTAIYNTTISSWSAGPDLPSVGGQTYTLADAPAALLPTGNVLFAASPNAMPFSTPTHFFEFTGGNEINPVADTSDAAGTSSYYWNFLVLPTGQVLATNAFTSVAWIYTPAGNINSSWAPTVTSVPTNLSPGGTYQLSGTQLNGLSQGAAYGDDAQAATNYPIVRITNNSSGHVFYATTSGWSNGSIAPNNASTVNFTVPSSIETGISSLVAIANGIVSRSVCVTVGGGTCSSRDILSVSLVGFGSVTSSPAGINCPGTCSTNFASGSNVTLPVGPASGLNFGSWSGACTGSDGCVVTMTTNQSVMATFWSSGSVVPFPSAAAPQASAGPGGAPAAP